MNQRFGVSLLVLLFLGCTSVAQAPTAVVNGQVRDASGAAIARATVEVFNDATRVRYSTETNDEGIYSVPNLLPGTYHIQVSKPGFKTVVHPDITLNVQDAKAIGFTLPVGPVSDTVTVEGGASLIDTESAAVSTVVDRQFAENLPMNGRSFQTLIQLTPGVVLTVTNQEDNGQFSINGQRADSNYWMVDGVSANIGTSVTPSGSAGNGLAGSLGSFSALGGTNSLVSVDALQEFRIQTSTFAPEFGRTPGGQISIVTRSGANTFHGTLFDYLRNDALDANNWFNGLTTPPLKKAEERQNDFGGTLGGPILTTKTFFFFSYEGLRLRLPQTTLTTVPDVAARQNASPALQPFLNVYPLPNGADNPATGIAQLNASYSNPATLDAASIRIDHRLNDKVTLFGRYNYSPSENDARGGTFGSNALSTVFSSRLTTQTATIGATWNMLNVVVNDLRFNYSRTSALGGYHSDDFHGAVPLTALPFPNSVSPQNSQLVFRILSLKQGIWNIGPLGSNLQRQINIVDSTSVQEGTHALKLGVDFRRLSPQSAPLAYEQLALFGSVASAEQGSLLVSAVESSLTSTFLFRNLGLYAQDTWRALRHLTLTYGLRWDVDFAPDVLSGPNFPAVTGFNLNNLSNLAVGQIGTQPYKTAYGNVAPRIGIAYQVSQSHEWQTVLRGGFGVFYDLATSEAGNAFNVSAYPFGSSVFHFGGTFPLSTGAAAPAPVTPPSAASPGVLLGFDPQLKLPYTLEWNVGLEQALGKVQNISVSYIGAEGRRLLQTADIFSPNPSITQTQLVTNSATSDYQALQLQFQRRLSRGLQALASYTWSHSIDDGSAGSIVTNTFAPASVAGSNRGPSDFDIRNAFSVGATLDLPSPKFIGSMNTVLRGWSVQNVVQARSAPPVDLSDADFQGQFNNGFSGVIRPDLVPGKALFLVGTQCLQPVPAGFGQTCPGGKGINPNAFTDPPADSTTGNPIRQGNVPRNFLRGFGAFQWDFAVHRIFPIFESLRLDFRTEMFNVLNHPNFGQPSGVFGLGGFGLSSQTLGQNLSGVGAAGSGAFSPLYQIGGPRSIQFGLKLMF